jgi:hypothetical protein
MVLEYYPSAISTFIFVLTTELFVVQGKTVDEWLSVRGNSEDKGATVVQLWGSTGAEFTLVPVF